MPNGYTSFQTRSGIHSAEPPPHPIQLQGQELRLRGNELRLISGIAWNTVNTLVNQACGFLRLVIVAAAIGPEGMGRLAVAASVLLGLNAVSSIGMRQLYISRTIGSDNYSEQSITDTVWFGNVLQRFGILIFALPVGVVADAFIDGPTNVYLIGALAVAFFVQSFESRGLMRDEKQGEFKRVATTNSVAQILGVATAILLVQEYSTPWVLVISQGVSSVGIVLVSILIYQTSGWPQPVIRLLGELLRKGVPFLKIGVTTFITYNLDKLLVASMLSTTAAGIYSIGQRIAEVPALLVSGVLARTILPHYSMTLEAQGDAGLQKQLKNMLLVVFVIFFTIFVAIWLLLEAGVSQLVPSEWHQSLKLLPIFLVGVAARGATQVVSPALIVIGKVGVDAKFKFQETIIYLLGFPTFVFFFGLHGAAVGFTMIYFFSAFRRVRYFYKSDRNEI